MVLAQVGNSNFSDLKLLALGRHHYISWMTVPLFRRKSPLWKRYWAFSSFIIFPNGKVVKPLYIHYQIENKTEQNWPFYYFHPTLWKKIRNYFHHLSNLIWLALSLIRPFGKIEQTGQIWCFLKLDSNDAHTFFSTNSSPRLIFYINNKMVNGLLIFDIL